MTKPRHKRKDHFAESIAVGTRPIMPMSVEPDRCCEIRGDGGYGSQSERPKVEFEVTEGPQGPQARNVRGVE